MYLLKGIQAVFINYTDETKLQRYWKAGLKFQIEKLFGEKGKKKKKASPGGIGIE